MSTAMPPGPSVERSGGAPVRRSFRSLLYKLTFADKILLSTIAILLLLAICGALTFQVFLRSRLRSELAEGTGYLAMVAAGRAAELFASADEEGLRRLAAEVAGLNAGIGYLVIRDRQGRVVAHSFSWDPPSQLDDMPVNPLPAGAPVVSQVSFDGVSYLDVVLTIVVDGKGAGFLELGVPLHRANQLAWELTLLFMGLLSALSLMGVIVARGLVKYVSRPIRELTHLADQVSLGNLDVDFDMGISVRCWELKNCRQSGCAAYNNTAVQCWFVDGTPCEGYEPRFPQKLVGCRTCEVYRAHKGDEIVQLADSFRHMTHSLRASHQELQRAYQFQKSLIWNSLGGIIATDESDAVQVFNAAAQNLTGYSEEDVVGRMKWEQLFVHSPSSGHQLQVLENGSKAMFGFYRKEAMLHRKGGGEVEVLATGNTLMDGDRIVGKVFFVNDLREVKKLRLELVRTERLAAVGQTVSSISHSIKNILDGLRGGAYVYKRGLRKGDGSITSEGWEMVERNIDRISSLVADLLNFAKEREPDLAPEDPNRIVTDVVELLAAKARASGVLVDVDLDDSVVPWLLDEHGIHQCLTNLITNAIDAFESRDSGHVLVTTRVMGTDTLCITVRDDGPGIPRELMSQVFSGMVSTKGSRGTGLGLLVVHKVVAEHGGQISVEETPGGGATFVIMLPGNRPR